MTLGKAISRRREELGLTLTDLATASGMAPGTIARIESDSVKPSATTIRRLTPVLKTSAYELELLAGYMPERAYNDVMEYLKRGNSLQKLRDALK